MKFQLVLLFGASALFASSFAGPAGGRVSWNVLLGADNLFPEEIDGRSYVEGNEVAQLEEMLAAPEFIHHLYMKYVKLYNKVNERTEFTDSNEQLFKDRLIEIAKHNLEFRAGTKSWEKGVNQFTDLTRTEFLSRFTGLISLQSSFGNSSVPQVDSQDPTYVTSLEQSDNLDWRTKNVVGSVKNQGDCGSCVPFGLTSTMESAQAKGNSKAPLDLSEQQIVDCCKGNSGCKGGSYPPALEYLKQTGQVLENDYKYEARQGKCRISKKAIAARLVSYGNVQERSESDLQAKMAEYGPIAIAVHVSDQFASYRSGIFEGPCDGGRNHAVSVVGYGTQNGKAYWIVKNSWGKSWGQEGYILLAKDKNNMCDVAGDGVFLIAK